MYIYKYKIFKIYILRLLINKIFLKRIMTPEWNLDQNFENK